MDWFLYDGDLRHKRVKNIAWRSLPLVVDRNLLFHAKMVHYDCFILNTNCLSYEQFSASFANLFRLIKNYKFFLYLTSCNVSIIKKDLC